MDYNIRREKSFFLLLILVTSPLLFFVFVKTGYTDNKLADKSDLIVDGEVKNIESELKGKTVFSYVNFYVMKVKKGTDSTKGKEIVIKFKGGEVRPGEVYWQSDQPNFAVGDIARLYLKKEDNAYAVLGGPQGKISLNATTLEPLIEESNGLGYKLQWYCSINQSWRFSAERPGPEWYGPGKWYDSDIPVDYWINVNSMPTGISASSFEFHAQQSYQNWEDDPQSYIDYTYRGIRSDVGWDWNDGINIFMWEPIDGSGGTLGVCQKRFSYIPEDYDSLRIREADISLDTAEQWSCDVTCPPNRIDVQNVGTHEAGHSLGLADLYESEYSTMTMYGFILPGEIFKRDLNWGDQGGVRYLYPLYTASITIDSNPQGAGFIKVDSSAIVTPQTFSWIIDSNHMIEAISPVNDGSDTRYIWDNWSDGGEQNHSYTVPSLDETVNANYITQYQLKIETYPLDGGTTEPSSGSYWYDANSSLIINQTSSTDYSFDYWAMDGVKVSTDPSYYIEMNAPHNITAYYRMNSNMTLFVNGGNSITENYGSAVQLSGSLSVAVSAPVNLYLSRDGGSDWESILVVYSNPDGDYNVSWIPPYPDTYLLKANWTGDNNYFGDEIDPPYPTITVTGSRPIGPRLLIYTDQTTQAQGTLHIISILVFSGDSASTDTLTIKITGPNSYIYQDFMKVSVPASSHKTYVFKWDIPGDAPVGIYKVEAELIPPKLSAYDFVYFQVR